MAGAHRAVMSAHLGRPLRRDEHVHHINGDPSDNRVENLRVLSAGDHSRLHARERALGKRSGFEAERNARLLALEKSAEDAIEARYWRALRYLYRDLDRE
jgi:hypothetical protein